MKGNHSVLVTPPATNNGIPEDSRQRAKQFMLDLQDEICHGLEALDGQAKFHQDMWQPAEGGEGRTRVIREGRVFAQGGVNFSESL